jgi:hypothetical protein
MPPFEKRYIVLDSDRAEKRSEFSGLAENLRLKASEFFLEAFLVGIRGN